MAVPGNGHQAITGIHHVRIPVVDVLRSRDWYMDVLGFAPLVDYEEEDRLIGVVLEHPSGIVLGLHEDPERARALGGFAVLGLSASDLSAWLDDLDRRDVPHGALEEGHLGQFAQVPDPDNIVIELHTADQPSADEA